MSNEKWAYMQKLAMVFALLFTASFIANVILAGYISTIQSLAESKPSYTYVVGVVYEERWVSNEYGGHTLRRVPIWGAKVTLEDANCYTGQCGYFSFTVEQDTYEVKFEKEKYYTEYRIVHVYSLEYIEVEMKQKIVLKEVK